MRALLLKEWRIAVRNPRFVLLWAGVLCLVIASAVASAWQTSGQAIERERASSEDYRRWVEQGDRHAHRAAHQGFYVFRQESILTAFDPGVTRYAGPAVWLEAHVQNAAQYRPAQDQTALARQLPLAPGPLLLFLLPLLAAVLGHGLVAEEREQGTLRMAVLHAGSTYRLLMSKTVLLAFLLVIPVIVGLGASWAASMAFSLRASEDGGLRLAALLALYGVYAGFWAALTVAVSAWIGRSGAVLTALITLWAFSVLIVPRILVGVAHERLPEVSRDAFEHALAVAIETADPVDRIEQLKKRLLREHGAASLEELPQHWAGVSYQEGEDLGNAIFDQRWHALYDRYEAQQLTVAQLAWLSPSASLQWLSQRLAGSDIWHQRAFTQRAEMHRRHIQRTLNDELKQHVGRPGPPVSGRHLWERVRPFTDGSYTLVEATRAEEAGWRVALVGLIAGLVMVQVFLGFAARRLERAA